jgi:DNA polymerase-3 subunit epsilon
MSQGLGRVFDRAQSRYDAMTPDDEEQPTEEERIMEEFKPYVSIDAETTGTDPATDRIITFSVHKRWSTKVRNGNTWTFNPGRPIPQSATDVHGITDADVAGEHPFTAAIANQIIEFIGADAILVGFNLLKFDIPIFQAELVRCGFKGEWPPQGMLVIDALGIYRKLFPHTLTAAVKQFCGREHEQAHDSLEDAEATADVLEGILKQHPALAEMTVDDLARYSQPTGMVDFSGKLFRDDAGDVCYGFGKNWKLKVRDAKEYSKWMLSSDFPVDTKRALEAELRRIDGRML